MAPHAGNTPDTIILNGGLSRDCEVRVDENLASVRTCRARWKADQAPRTYVLPADGERFRAMWARLRQLPQPSAAERGLAVVDLESSGTRVAEFICSADGDRFPFWQGVVREIEAAARADIAYALAYREAAEAQAERGEWLLASADYERAVESAIAARQFYLAGVLWIDDAELFSAEPRSLRRAGGYEEAVRLFREMWNGVMSGWVSTTEHGDVVEVSLRPLASAGEE
jgi:hypothetical protein